MSIHRKHTGSEPATHGGCPIALSSAELRVGDGDVLEESGLKHLHDATEVLGSPAQVTVGSGATSRAYGLRRATAGEEREFGSPPTRSRIDSGVDRLAGGA